jgi:type IV secretion system protein VirB10
MMINDGKAGAGQIVPDLANPQALLAAAQQATTAVQPKTEGLLAGPPAGSLEAELSPSKTPMVQAAKLNDLNFLLPKGKTIDCGMSMKIVSSLAGLASCVLTSNIYSANGKVVLLERGSEAVGEYRSGVSVGQRRLFVLWDRIITPSGVVINLESPGADELGSTGLTGRVDNHWFERIGSAFLLSTVQDAIQYEVAAEQAKSAGGVALVFGNTAQTGNSMADKVLDATINIPATIYKDQGDRAVIYVARDLDFSNVYRLAARP